MTQQTNDCDCKVIEVIVEPDTVIEVIEEADSPVTEVQIQGERGAKGDKGDKGDSFNDTPFDFDPTEIYLKAKNGEI